MISRGNRIVIIGVGMVGSTFAYALMINGLASEIIMIDANSERLEGEVLDLNHGSSFVRPALIRAGTYEDCRDADLIVIAAGASQLPGESRLDLLGRNTKIFDSIIGQIKAVGTKAILLVATNPVDIMTYVTCKLSGFEPGRVIGSGTVLDSARFRYLLSKHCQVDPTNVHAYIIGEHGDSEVPVWSLANIAGIRFQKYCPVCGRNCGSLPKETIFDEVKNSAYRIIKGKGSTYYAIGLALVQIAESILRDEYSVLTVSTMLDGEYGLEDVCLSLPSIVTRQGVIKKIAMDLSQTELDGLLNSARVLKDFQKKLSI